MSTRPFHRQALSDGRAASVRARGGRLGTQLPPDGRAASVPTRGGRRGTQLPRDLHPGAWWIWALSLATAASGTLNPVLLGLILAVSAYVVVRRRGDAPWARGFKYYLVLALVVITIRVVLRVFLGGGEEAGSILFRLPELTLPDAAAGIQVGGAVSAGSVAAAAFDGLRLATMLVCLGAANALANPKRLLTALPGALYELGMAVVVALSVAPQLVESVLRVRRARRLRGGMGSGLRALPGILLPVLEDALERSLRLAASMDSRGYGRRGDTPRRARLLSGALLVGGLIGVCAGLYGLLSRDDGARSLGLASFVAGGAVGLVGMVVGGRHLRRTRYRPDPWRGPEWVVAGGGAAAAVAMIVIAATDPTQLYPSVFPLVWPTLPLVPALGITAALLPAWLAPPVAVRSVRPGTLARSVRPEPPVLVPALRTGKDPLSYRTRSRS